MSLKSTCAEQKLLEADTTPSHYAPYGPIYMKFYNRWTKKGDRIRAVPLRSQDCRERNTWDLSGVTELLATNGRNYLGGTPVTKQ